MDNLYKINTNSTLKKRNLPSLITFLKSLDLDFDNNINYCVTLTDENENIVATGSLDNNVIKCLGVSPLHRNEGLSSKIVSQLISHASQSGIRKLFVYTKPVNEKMFLDLGFYTIEKTNKILLMENEKNGFKKYLSSVQRETNDFLKISKIQPSKIGCIVANCNPFTNGHLYLMDTASKQCDLLHVFILSGSNKFFSETDRFNLVKKGLKNYNNIIVHRAKEYILSPLTFPTYFIKDKRQTTQINCELDINIFLEKIVPLLNINQRFLGTENNDLVTNSYNNELIKALDSSPVSLKIIERKKVGDSVISASTVRRFIENKDFSKIKKFVPLTTYDFIISKFDKTSLS